MPTIAMMVSRESLDSPLARTFGKARWLLLHGPGAQVEFRRNDMLSGGLVASAIAASGCRDVIAAHLGQKAHDHLLALGIRIWRGAPDTSVRDLIALHARGELAAWQEAPFGATACASEGARREKPHDHGAAAAPDPIVRIGTPRRGDSGGGLL